MQYNKILIKHFIYLQTKTKDLPLHQALKLALT